MVKMEKEHLTLDLVELMVMVALVIMEQAVEGYLEMVEIIYGPQL
jgi:hypothetical protein